MASWVTPNHPRDSTVFMTPSSSNGKPIYPKPRVTPLSFSLLSPAATPKTLSRGNKDVLIELHFSGVPHIVDTILSMLSPSDLCSSLQVSHSWNELISVHSQCMARIKAHRKKCKDNAENSGVTNKSSLVPFRPQRQRALSVVDENSQALHVQVLKKTTPLPNFKPQSIEIFRPCPNCQSPAKELTFRRSECSNTNCRFDFCQRCFMPWHENECSRRTKLSPKRPSSDKLAGTSKSKKRLRRL